MRRFEMMPLSIVAAAKGRPLCGMRVRRERATMDALPNGGGTLTAASLPPCSTIMGATGFDMVVLRGEAGRGLLATLNRGTVKLN